MKNLLNKILITIGLFILNGCGSSNNVTFTTQGGQCANQTNTGPYCMGIVIQNNSGGTGGQNWINSTNFPISQISYTISGVSNVLTPATNSAGSTNSMDPNNCAGSTIQPGGTCEFYVQINKEAFGVQSQESVNISISYTVNDTLFGGSTNTGNANITLYELTNLYIGQNNGYMNVYNNAWSNYGHVESADTIAAIAADTNNYGNIYLGGTLGVYPFGITTNAIAGSSISSSTYPTGSNNLFSTGASLYVAQLSSSNNVINSYSFSGESWGAQPYGSGSFTGQQIANANAYIGSNTYIATSNGSINGITVCLSSVSNTCQSEGTNGISGTITSIAYLGTSIAPTSGLYAGSNNANGGLFYESGSTPNQSATWAPVTGESYAITAMTSSISNNEIYVGDANGQISVITTESPTIAIFLESVPVTPILYMVYDNNGGVIYVASSNQLYACDPAGAGCINTNYTIQNSSTVTGMTIGSMLVDSLNNIYDQGSL